MICPNHILKLNLAQKIMNTDNYRVELRNGPDPHCVAFDLSEDYFRDAYYWRGVNLCDLDVWGTTSLIQYLNFEMTSLMNRYPDAPFPTYTRNFVNSAGNGARFWHNAQICFIQTQARKIQKCWRARATEVAMPCAEEVE